MKILPAFRNIILIITLAVVLLSVVSPVLAIQSKTLVKPPVKVTARVGEFYLSLSGYASPYASVILTSGGVFYRSAVADQNGSWSINDILINKNFSSFCLQHIDYKNIGESTTCLTVPPATADIIKKDIFLPPTIGLQRSEIIAGGNAVVFGYTMPGSTVTIHLKNGKSYVVLADLNGYYELTLKNLEAGSYELYATAVYNGIPSENPSNTLKLVALSWWDQLLVWLKKLLQWLWSVITGFGLGPLWLVLPLIPFIIYLLVRLWPERFTFIYDNEIYVFFHPRKKLHHAWMFGY